MPKIVRQSQSLSEIFIDPQSAGDSPGYLSHFDRMRQTIPEVIVQARGEDLSFVFQPAKGSGVYDSVPVPLEFVAIRMAEFREASSTALSNRESKV